jgi:hypothetical protein
MTIRTLIGATASLGLVLSLMCNGSVCNGDSTKVGYTVLAKGEPQPNDDRGKDRREPQPNDDRGKHAKGEPQPSDDRGHDKLAKGEPQPNDDRGKHA